MSLVKWKVSEAETSRFSSFHKRGWPMANYKADGEVAAMIMCEDAYVPRHVASGDHAPLSLRIADHSVKPWAWKRAKATFTTLQEAKDALDRILTSHPEFAPVAKV